MAPLKPEYTGSDIPSLSNNNKRNVVDLGVFNENKEFH